MPCLPYNAIGSAKMTQSKSIKWLESHTRLPKERTLGLQGIIISGGGDL
jgi:hypothetical protein